MKKFGFMVLSFIVAAASLTSCNTSSGDDYAHNQIFAVAHQSSIGVYFESDDHQLLYPANNRVGSSYNPNEGDRVIISYNILEQESLVGNFDYMIDLYSISKVRWGEQASVETTQAAESYGTEPVALYQEHMFSSTKEILNMALTFYGLDPSKHTFTIVENNDPNYNPELKSNQYKNVELRHSDTENNTSRAYAEWVSFPLDELELDGYRGLIIDMKNFQSSQSYVTVTFTVFNSNQLKPATL